MTVAEDFIRSGLGYLLRKLKEFPKLCALCLVES